MKSVKYFEEKENLSLGILLALSKTIDTKSRWTSGHSERVAAYAGKLAVKMGMGESFINDLRISASLHDIGKIGVPEAILDKPDLLSGEEYDVIKRHPQAGVLIVEDIPGHEKFINGILFHHEAWDGSGYPFGLEGRGIPLMGRLIAVADVYDSLISDRPYRSGMELEKALAILVSEKGRKLDPAIVDLMIEIIENEKE
jgi:HD-GYP domain-containing protein (c-di-GMP phosphodiesterase class II)